MTSITIQCDYCNKEFEKDLRRVNENRKFRHKSYCSFKCLSNNRLRRKLLVCENPQCQKCFERSLGDISSHNYCSQSCSAIVNNSLRLKRVRICSNYKCKNKFFGNNKYCSLKCVPKTQPKYSKEELLGKIKTFYHQNGRIPLKREFYTNWQAYHRVFGSWNKAIKEAGYNPNKEIFTHRFIAKDGHICDSFAEKIIDDWMFKRGVSHKRSVYYPGQRKFETDFLIQNKYWVEFLGLRGVLKRYDDLYKQKLEIAKNNKIKIVELCPQDLFPVNKLSRKLGFLLKSTHASNL